MKLCSDCPFKTSSPIIGSADWLENIFKMHHVNPFFYHSCHKTDLDSDGYKGGKKRECAGHIQMILNEEAKTPGHREVYKSIHALMETYLRHWLGNEEFELMKSKTRVVGK